MEKTVLNTVMMFHFIRSVCRFVNFSWILGFLPTEKWHLLLCLGCEKSRDVKKFPFFVEKNTYPNGNVGRTIGFIFFGE